MLEIITSAMAIGYKATYQEYDLNNEIENEKN